MGVTVTNIGSINGNGPLVINIGSGGVPANAHIIVSVAWNATSNLPTVTDTAGNTYLISGSATAQSINNNSANGASAVFRERTGLALVNGNSITVTLPAGSTIGAANAFYALGLAAVGADTAFYNSAFGNTTTPNVTSNSPTYMNELVVAIVSASASITTYTQDTTNANWASPPGIVSTSAPVLGGAFVINNVGALTYAPTFDASRPWAATIVGFAATPEFGFNIQQVDLPGRSSAANPRLKYSAARTRSEFAIFSRTPPIGWPIQPFQPPHPPLERRAAIMKGDDGVSSKPPLKWVNIGTEVQSVQPPHPRPERTGAIMIGDDGIRDKYKFVGTPTWGWENIFQLIPHPRTEKVAATKAKSEFAIFPRTPPIGFAEPDRPYRKPFYRAGAFMVGDGGIQNKFAGPAIPSWGFEFYFHPPFKRQIGTAVEGRSEFQTPTPLNIAWDYVTSMPYHVPLQKMAAATMVGDVGAYDIMHGWKNIGYEVQPVQPPHPWWEKRGTWFRGDDGFYNPPPIIFKEGWQVQHVQPPHFGRESRTGWMRGDDGIQGIYSPLIIGWPAIYPQPPHRGQEPKGAAWLRGDDGIQAPVIFRARGWEQVYSQEPHRGQEYKAAAWLRGDDGIQDRLRVIAKGWEFVYSQEPHFGRERAAAMMAGDQGTQGLLAAQINPGWPIIILNPPHPWWERRAASIMRGHDGIEAKKISWFNSGWEVQPVQPPHPHPEWRSAAIMPWDNGNELPFSTISAIFAGRGGLTVTATLVPHICVIPGPGPAKLPTEGPGGPKVC